MFQLTHDLDFSEGPYAREKGMKHTGNLLHGSLFTCMWVYHWPVGQSRWLIEPETLGQECFNTEKAQGCFLMSTVSCQHNHIMHTLKPNPVGFSSASKACSYRKEQCQVLLGGLENTLIVYTARVFMQPISGWVQTRSHEAYACENINTQLTWGVWTRILQ